MMEMRTRFVAGCLVALIAGSDVMAADCVRDSYGNAVCGKGQCMTDQYGKVFCAKEGAGAVKDRYGTVKCGVGYCETDNSGEIMCSVRPGGNAAMDANGRVQCLGGCQPASAQLCDAPR
jgi:hypothetical protein